MLSRCRIKPLLFSLVYFILFTFTTPMTLFAGPSTKCPCFSAREISRDIARGSAILNCFWMNKAGEPGWDSNRKRAEITIVTQSGYLIYSVDGKNSYKYEQAAAPTCGTIEILYDFDAEGWSMPNSGIYKIYEQEVGVYTVDTFNQNDSAEAVECYNIIRDAYQDCVEDVYGTYFNEGPQ